MELTPSQRRHLRALAHSLKPVVRAYKPKGEAPYVLSEGAVAEVDAQLGRLELVKVKLRGANRKELEAALQALLQATGAAWVQTIGHTLVLYRPHPEAPEIRLPRPRPPAEASAEGAEAGEE